MIATTDMLHIESTQALDAITVYWENREPGRGRVTLVCWDSAWTCFFGAMSGGTIQEFFAAAGTEYLIDKLGITQRLYRRKRDLDYLRRIIVAVKEAMGAR